MSDRPTLKHAMTLVSRRKMTVAGKVGTMDGIVIRVDDDAARQILIGTDLSLEEIREAATEAIKAPAAGLLFDEKMTPFDALATTWTEGVLVGLKLAELRAQASLHEEQRMRAEEAEMRRRSAS